MRDRLPLPWRVFGVIGLLIVVTAFSALNLENRSDVSLGVYTFRGVPVFLTSLIALILGAILVVPLTLRRGLRRRTVAPDRGGGDEETAEAEDPMPAEPEHALPDDMPPADVPGDEHEPEPEEAPRRRRRWPFGARHQDQDDALARDRDTGGGR